MTTKAAILNAKFALGYEIGQEFQDCQRQLSSLRTELKDIQSEMGKLKESFLLHRILTANLMDFDEEIQYLRRQGRLCVYPYEQVKIMGPIQSGWDAALALPYVLHKGKRLYFPSSWTVLQAEERYRGYVEGESLLGGGYRKRAPHQYQVDGFRVQQGDVVLDVGAAEGLFALDVLETASKIFIFECDPLWIDALKATFAPYADRVVLSGKKVTDVLSDQEVTIESVLKSEDLAASYFMKMDIEGGEVDVVKSMLPLLRKMSNARLVCCTYHRQGDAEALEKLFAGIGYSTHFSDGHMLYIYDELDYPFFRKGLIRARCGQDVSTRLDGAPSE